MIGLHQSLKARYPGLRLFDLEERSARLCNAEVRESDAAETSPVSKLPLKVRDALQVAPRRNDELSAGFAACFNDGILIPLFVLSRATLETACLAWDLWERVLQLLESSDSAGLAELDNHLMRVLLGAKSEDWVGAPEKFMAPNILTLLDRLGKAGYPQLRKFYDILSEFAHPNFSGMQAVYAELDAEARKVHYLSRPLEREEKVLVVAVNAVVLSLELTASSAERYEARLSDFVRRCEDAIHARGDWPSGVPYPRG